MSDGDRTGVVVLFALEREATPFRQRVIGRPGVHVLLTGVGSLAEWAATVALARHRPRLVIMAGFCGGLNPAHPVGRVLVPREIISTSGDRWRTAASLLPDEFPGITRIGRLLTADRIIAEPREKLALGDEFRADAVDLESAAVAAACAAEDVPFLAVRAVSDAADTRLSPALMRLFAGGDVTAWRAVRAMLRHPSLLGEFRRLARDTKLTARNLADTLAAIVARSPAARG